MTGGYTRRETKRGCSLNIAKNRGRRAAFDQAPHDRNGQTKVIDFSDNRLLVELFGDHDQNLARIEDRLNVHIAARGNRVTIAGSAGAQIAAEQTLKDLYRRLERGHAIEIGDVDGAIRMVAAPAPAHDNDKDLFGNPTDVRTKKRNIAPRSPNQGAYVKALREHSLTFGVGPAGTGKTYLAVAVAVQMLIDGKVDRIVLSRPAVEAGEKLGYLPGDLKEKIDPYLRPLYDALHDMMPGDQVEKRLERNEIEIAPLAFMRGRTLTNSYIIVDEAQNTTVGQMKMLLTRMGENSRLAVTGDVTQCDLPRGTKSGLEDALDVLEGVEGIAFVHFTQADVVRHPMVAKVINAYENYERRLELHRG